MAFLAQIRREVKKNSKKNLPYRLCRVFSSDFSQVTGGLEAEVKKSKSLPFVSFFIYFLGDFADRSGGRDENQKKTALARNESSLE